MTGYKLREIAGAVHDALKNMPVVVLSGMRQTGKSTLLLHQPEFKNRKYISFDDFATIEAARRNPEGLIAGEDFLTIDEAQKYPGILSVIKRDVDKNRKPGRFLLSGSANFLLLKNVAESLAGRAIYLTLHPLTRREILGTTRQSPALIHFIKHGFFPGRKVSLIRWPEILTGGMPSICLGEASDPNIWFRGYEQTYLERDIRGLSQVADLVSFRNLLQLAAFRNAQVLKQSELARDAKLNVMTVSRYLSLMEISFVVRRLPPYLRNPSSRLIKSPKLYFSDSGLAAYLTSLRKLDVGSPLSGPLLECYVAQNLEGIFSSHLLDARIFYWHIQGRHEVDFIVEAGNEIIAIEVKNSSRWEEKDLTGMKSFLATSPARSTGILAYTGNEVVKLQGKIWAVPLHLLLS